MTPANRFCVAALCAGLWAAAPAGSAAQPLETATVAAASGDRTVLLPGELVAFEAVDVVARVAGYVDRLTVDRGTDVRRGQVLATIVAPELAAQVAEAQSRVAVAAAKRVEADAQLATARTTSERLKAASATEGAVAGLELQRAEDGVKGAVALADSYARAAEAAKASLDAVRALEGYLQLTAPFSGRITARYLHPGALVGPSAGPLLRLEEVDRLRLVVSVPERQFTGIARGRTLEFSVPAYPGRKFSGAVTRVSGSLDTKTRSMAVELDVANRDGVLAPGMFPEVAWPVSPSGATLLVPATAIVTTTERTFVIRVTGGKAQWVTVKKGAARGDQVEVTGALAAGDTIVKRGSDEIHDGSGVSGK